MMQKMSETLVINLSTSSQFLPLTEFSNKVFLTKGSYSYNKTFHKVIEILYEQLPYFAIEKFTYSITFGKSMKLGRAVEISPSVFREQFTSCDKISQAASADSLLLSTLKQNRFIGSENTASNTVLTKKQSKADILLLFFHFTF